MGFGGLRGERIRRVSWDRDAWVVEGGQFHGLKGMGGYQGVWSPIAEVLWCRGGLAPEIQHRAGAMGIVKLIATGTAGTSRPAIHHSNRILVVILRLSAPLAQPSGCLPRPAENAFCAPRLCKQVSKCDEKSEDVARGRGC